MRGGAECSDPDHSGGALGQYRVQAVPTCAVAGILGALTGVIGSMQALEAIKEIVGIGDGLVGRLLLYDARSTRFETIVYRWDPANPLNGRAAAE